MLRSIWKLLLLQVRWGELRLRLSRVDLLLPLICIYWMVEFSRWSSHQLLSHLLFYLGEISRHVHIRIVKLFLREFRDFSSLQALLIFKQAVGSSKEAFKGNDFFEESELRISLLNNLGLSVLLNLYCLMNSVLDLGVWCGNSCWSTYTFNLGSLCCCKQHGNCLCWFHLKK